MRLYRHRAARFIFCLIGVAQSGSELASSPQPGEVYREYVMRIGGDDWRVTNPEATNEQARVFLPNPILETPEISLDGAVRVEAELDVWGGHLRTIDRMIRFNENDWFAVPRPIGRDGQELSPFYYTQHNAVIPVPLVHLQSGTNIFEATCSHLFEGGWGQWGVYALTLRVYYDPTTVTPAIGRIVSPAAGATFRESPPIAIEATSAAGIERIDVIGWYDGFDENGDGITQDWHEANFTLVRQSEPVRTGHVGTATTAPYAMSWDTRWISDQPVEGIKLIARIRDQTGLWTVTEIVENLTLERLDFSVSLYPLDTLPLAFGVRAGGSQGNRVTELTLPLAANLPRAVEAGMHYRTWNGWDDFHQPFMLNEWEHLNEGRNHFYDNDFIRVPIDVLREGTNTFRIRSQTEEHVLEVLAPGPVFAVRSRTATFPVEADTSRLANLSVRARTGSEDDRLIVGVVAQGAGTHGALVRAVGPGLDRFGVVGTLTDPSLQIYRETELVASNQNWFESAEVDAIGLTGARVGAFALGPEDRDAALLTTLPAGGFTAHVAADPGESGVILAEIYDDYTNAPAGWRMMNLSARSQVQQGAGGLIAGFVISGENPLKLLLRGVGPSLGEYGIESTIEDPRITVFDSNGEVASNDDWSDDLAGRATADRAGAFQLTAAKDAALVATLPPGVYTVHVTDASGGEGIALIEIYELP